MDARSNKGFAAKSPFNREPVNQIKGNGRITMSKTKRNLIAMDGRQVRTLQPGQEAQFQGNVLEMDPNMLFELEAPLLEAHLGTLKADDQMEFVEKYDPLPENMKRAALMQIAQMHQDVIQAAAQAMAPQDQPSQEAPPEQEVQPTMKNGGRTKNRLKTEYQTGGTYQQVQAPTDGFQYTGIVPNKLNKDNTIDLGKAVTRKPRTTTKSSGKNRYSADKQYWEYSDEEIARMTTAQRVLVKNQEAGFNVTVRENPVPMAAEMQSQLYYDAPPISATTESIHTVTGRPLPPPMKTTQVVSDQRVPVMASGIMYNSNQVIPHWNAQPVLPVAAAPVYEQVAPTPAFSETRLNWNYRAQHSDAQVAKEYPTDSPFRGNESSFVNRKK